MLKHNTMFSYTNKYYKKCSYKNTLKVYFLFQVQKTNQNPIILNQAESKNNFKDLHGKIAFEKIHHETGC